MAELKTRVAGPSVLESLQDSFLSNREANTSGGSESGTFVYPTTEVTYGRAASADRSVTGPSNLGVGADNRLIALALSDQKAGLVTPPATFSRLLTRAVQGRTLGQVLDVDAWAQRLADEVDADAL